MLRTFKSAALARAPLADLLAHAPASLTPFGRFLKFALLFEQWGVLKFASLFELGVRIRFAFRTAGVLLARGSNSLRSLNRGVLLLLYSIALVNHF